MYQEQSLKIIVKHSQGFCSVIFALPSIVNPLPLTVSFLLPTGGPISNFIINILPSGASSGSIRFVLFDNWHPI